MIHYILNAALILSGCLIFYKLLLQKETFFPLNRFVLLSCLALSFSLPLVPVPAKLSFRKTTENIVNLPVAQAVKNLPVNTQTTKGPAAVSPAVGKKAPDTFTTIEKPGFLAGESVVNMLIYLYWTGVIIFAINFLVQFITLVYRAYSRPVIVDGKFRIVELTGDKAPCSFGNNIFINPEKYDWDTYNQILMHEKIHIEQGHSFDILFAELALVFQWFNPFAWFYRKAVEDNLEFLTDSELLLHNNVEVQSYQMSLVKVSAPHFPVSLTTNYNQSILKKRLIMMNAKKSNIHTTWKYLFILPLMVAFMCFLNEPVVAFGKADNSEKYSAIADFEKTGVWFATIKDNKMLIQFRKENEDNSNYSSSTFDLAEFKELPQGKQGTFALTRDAGTITFTGKFEDNMGMGKYEFKEDAVFIDFLKKAGVDVRNDNDIIAFYLVNVKRSYVEMLKAQGYSNFNSGDLIALNALKVDQDFIKMLKSNGFASVPLNQLVPLKAIGVDEKYIKEIRNAGYDNLSYNQLITYKAQNFSADFLKSSRDAANLDKGPKGDKSPRGDKGPKGSKDEEDDDEDGFDDLIAMKALNISKEFIQSFTNIGYGADKSDIIAFKSLGITPEYIKGIEAAGFPKPDESTISGMKALGITTEDIKAYKALGFKDLTLDDIISATATGTTPAYISEMKKKGFNLSSVEKYVSAKVLSISDMQ